MYGKYDKLVGELDAESGACERLHSVLDISL